MRYVPLWSMEKLFQHEIIKYQIWNNLIDFGSTKFEGNYRYLIISRWKNEIWSSYLWLLHSPTLIIVRVNFLLHNSIAKCVCNNQTEHNVIFQNPWEGTQILEWIFKSIWLLHTFKMVPEIWKFHILVRKSMNFVWITVSPLSSS